MKNKIYLLLFAFNLCNFVSAQKFEGGIKFGLAASQVAGDLYSGYNKAGLNAGGWINLSVSPKSEFQMELAYIQKGSRENPDQERGRYDTYLMRLGYVELPFLYRYSYNQRIEFEAGTGVNFLIHHKETFNGYELNDNPFKGMNLCFLAGLSYNVNDRFRVNIRTDNSLFSLRKNRISGDVWRFWDYGQYSDVLILAAYYRL